MNELKKRADIAYGRHIRSRDCPEGKGHCISCGTPITYETCENGHYIPRQHSATRFDDRNCNAQCINCNERSGGNIPGYERGLVRKYGPGILEELNQLKRKEVLLRRSDYLEIIKKYGKKIY